MQGVLRPVTALLLATAIAMAGHGILVMLLPLKASAANFSSFEIGVMGSGYFAGLVAGCLLAPSIIGRVGHIRAFSAFTASATAVPLLHAIAIDPVAWMLLRILQGLCLAGLWLVIESWLSASADTFTRGRVLGAYTLVQLVMQTAGMQLAGTVQLDGQQLFSITAILLSLSTLPIALTGAIAPMPPKRNKLRLAWLFKVSPAATLASVLVGFAIGSFWILAPLFAQNAGLSSAGSATFVAAALLAGALTQWPLGSLSDMFGRRVIITSAAAVAMGSSLTLGLSGTANMWLIFACSIIFGAASLPIYPIALAHANDLVPSKRAIMVSSGMLFMFSIGAAVGPLVASVIVESAGFHALFTTISIACGLIVLVTMVRSQIDHASHPRHREDFVVVPRTTPEIFNLDPRTDDPIATPMPPQSFTEPYQPAVPDVIAPDGVLPATSADDAEAEGARISHTGAVVTEANLMTGQEKHAMRYGSSDKWFDAVCHQICPARRVAFARPSAASGASTVCVSYAFRRPPGGQIHAKVARANAMTFHTEERGEGIQRFYFERGTVPQVAAETPSPRSCSLHERGEGWGEGQTNGTNRGRF